MSGGAEPPPPATTAPAPLVRYGVLSFAYFAGIGLFNPYAPLWFQSLGFPTLLIGGIAALQSWTRLVAPYGWSWWGDHGGRRSELIRLAAGLALVAAVVLCFTRSAWAVALATAALFLANGAVVPLSEALLAHALRTGSGVDPNRYGRVRMWGSVGFIVAVTGFGWVLERSGMDAFPWLVAAVYGLLLVAAMRLPASTPSAAHEEPPPPALRRLRDPAVAWFFASIFFTVLAHTSLYSFFSLYLDHLGYSKAAVGGLWAVSVGVEIAAFAWQGRWYHWFTPERWLVWAALATVLRFALVAGLGEQPWALLAAQALHALTFAVHHAVCISLVQRHFPGRLRGRGQALYSTLGYGLPGVLGGLGFGWLIDHQGYAVVFAVSAACALMAWPCVHFAQRRGAAG